MIEWKSVRPFTYRGRTYHWRTDRNRWELLVAGRVLASVVADAVYPEMWRIDPGGGVLSDIVKLSRAKDAAVRLVDASLNVTKPLRRALPVREMESPATLVPSRLELAEAVP